MAIDVNIATTFLGNTDTPNSYSGQAGKFPKVNVSEDGLEFDEVVSGLEVDVTPVDGGNSGYVFYKKSDNTFGQVSDLFYNPTLGFVGVGTNNPSARLNVKAQGGLSTDKVFSLENTWNGGDLFRVAGDGAVTVGAYSPVGMYVETNGAWGVFSANAGEADFVASAKGSNGGFYIPHINNVFGMLVECPEYTPGGEDKIGYCARDFQGENWGGSYTGFMVDIQGISSRNTGIQINVTGGTQNLALDIINGNIRMLGETKIGESPNDQFAFWGSQPTQQQILPMGSSTDEIIKALQDIGLFRNS